MSIENLRISSVAVWAYACAICVAFLPTVGLAGQERCERDQNFDTDPLRVAAEQDANLSRTLDNVALYCFNRSGEWDRGNPAVYLRKGESLPADYVSETCRGAIDACERAAELVRINQHLHGWGSKLRGQIGTGFNGKRYPIKNAMVDADPEQSYS